MNKEYSETTNNTFSQFPSDKYIYRKLQQHLDKYPIGFPSTKSGVELKLLKLLFNPLEAKIALCLSLTNTSISTIALRLKNKFQIVLQKNELKKILNKLFMAGAIDRSGQKRFQYKNAMLAIGMFEFQVNQLTKEFIEYMKEYFEDAFGEEFFHSSLPQLRTSPHLKAIVPEHRIATYDNMRRYIKKTKKLIHVMNCVCKQGEELLGNPCKQVDNLEVCILFGESSHLARGHARTITQDECLKLIDLAEKKGLVLQPANSLQPFSICLCCGCCCGVLTTAKKLEKPARHLASNYYAQLDPFACKQCSICIKRCQMDAIIQKDNQFIIDLDRCIGCGLCVTKCPAQALKLMKKEQQTIPPLHHIQLYLSILKEKVGRKKMMFNMLKLLFGKQL
ncbi:MAG: 4Fe-4S binding protein [Spirochaetes bacterium]|nr:4Fe-4S binding protein [Spirochaetota bacterium]